MILNEPLGQLRQQLRAVYSGPECEFFEFHCCAGSKLEIFRIDDHLQQSPAQIELTAEASARSESHQLYWTLRRRKRDQAVERAAVRRGRHLVMLRVRVGTHVFRFADGPAVLAQHLESFGVQPRARRQRKVDVEQYDFLQPDGLATIVDQSRTTQRAVPLTNQPYTWSCRHNRTRRVGKRL